MLKKQNRLQLRTQSHFFAQAKRFSTVYWTLWYVPHPSGFQATVIVPKKAVAQATDRNAVKRKILAAIQTQSYLPAFSIAISVRKPVTQLSFLELQQQIADNFTKINSRKAHPNSQ